MSKKSIDLQQVKAARKTLKEIASEHPELLGERGPENVKGWETILAENKMGKTSMVAFRLENELFKADRHLRDASGGAEPWPQARSR
jgi:hypothetical protein